MDNLSKRLDQIDSKLDKLSDAVSRLAMIEERITHQTTGLNRQNERLDGHEKRLRQLEFQSSTRGVILSLYRTVRLDCSHSQYRTVVLLSQGMSDGQAQGNKLHRDSLFSYHRRTAGGL